MKKFVYGIYKRTEKNELITTLFHFLYRVLDRGGRPIKYDPKKIVFRRKDYYEEKVLSDLKIAVICDEMTYVNLQEICKVFFLTPNNWFDVMEKEQPDLFFCEAAWSGIDKYKNIWRGKIYKNRKLLFENRGTLLNILDYCNRSGLKTIFWNKEDPVYFDDECHNFSDTALKFDYIFTTAEECVARYKERGHENVFLMGFGFSPKLFNCPQGIEKENKAIFAGSWYGDHAERCRDMEKAFDTILEKQIPLVIYDRHWGSANPLHQFPERYKPYIYKSVEYKELAEIYRKARFAVNINTERDSDTMYARRVHELMACRCIVISNESRAMRKRFRNRVWFLDDSFDLQDENRFCEENYQYVMMHFSNEVLFREMFNEIGVLVK